MMSLQDVTGRERDREGLRRERVSDNKADGGEGGCQCANPVWHAVSHCDRCAFQANFGLVAARWSLGSRTGTPSYRRLSNRAGAFTRSVTQRVNDISSWAIPAGTLVASWFDALGPEYSQVSGMLLDAGAEVMKEVLT
jgi:hypothetical protein